MPHHDGGKLDRKIHQIAGKLPESAGGFLRWLKEPSSRWVRVPSSYLIILNGLLAVVSLAALSTFGSAKPAVIEPSLFALS